MKLVLATIAAGLALAASTAKANFIVLYTSNTANVYNYTLRFTVDQPGEVLRSGDTVTLYDLSLPADITSVVGPAVGFTTTQQLTGITPAGLIGAPGITDSATLQNITFTYTGADRTTPNDYVGTVVTMAAGLGYGTLKVGKESGSTHIDFNLIPPVASQVDSSIRSVLLPAITGGTPNTPEPASLAVMGLGAAGLLLRRRKA